MNWNMIKNIMITCIFVVALLVGWNWNTNQINQLKNKLEVSEYQLECHKIALNEAKIQIVKQVVNTKRVLVKPDEKIIIKPEVNMYKELVKKHDLHSVKYMFKKGSMGATLYCVDDRNNQVGYIDISSGILVKTPRTFWGTARESKFLMVWKRN